MKLLKDLVLALVNATVLLLVILAVVVLMIVNRTDALAHEVIDVLSPVGDDIEAIATAVEKIEDDLAARPVGAEAEALATEIAALRAEVEALRTTVGQAGALSAQAIAAAVFERIAGVAAP